MQVKLYVCHLRQQGAINDVRLTTKTENKEQGWGAMEIRGHFVLRAFSFLVHRKERSFAFERYFWNKQFPQKPILSQYEIGNITSY